MGEKSSLKKAALNMSAAAFTQAFSMLLSFVNRTIFIQTLGNDYLSCNGLFSNILTLLSFSELGIGTAVIYSLYQPVAIDDRVMIRKLLHFFCKAYKCISIIITVIGVSLIPFLPRIIHDVPSIHEDLRVLYSLFLANTVCSYFFSYKNVLLNAKQQNYIVLIINQLRHIACLLLQTVFLLVTHNYILYLSIAILTTIGGNFVCFHLVGRMFPWVNDAQSEHLNREERKSIFLNVFSITFYKIGAVIFNGTDSLIISAVLNTSMIGLCSNYTLIINAIRSVVNQIGSSVQASIGIFNVTALPAERKQLFERSFQVSFFLVSVCAVCLNILITPFVSDVWRLGESYVVSDLTVLSLCLSFYVAAINTVPVSFRSSLGLFNKTRFAPLLGAIMNIVLSVLLAEWIGLPGIFFSTAISQAMTYNAFDTYYLFADGFQSSPIKAALMRVGYFLLLCVNMLLTRFVISKIQLDGIFGFFVKAVVCFLCAIAINIMALHRTASFHSVLSIFQKNKRSRHDAA